MVLSDKEIYKYINQGNLDFAVTNRNMRFNMYEQVQPSSVDLRLGNRIIRFKKDLVEFDIKNLDDVKDYIEVVIVEKGEPIRLEPNELIFCQTFEKLKMPDNCMGIIEGKSRFARLGLAVHSTGGFINPEFEGVMPLQIINNNKIPIVIYPYIAVCQLILIKTESIPLIPYPLRTNNPYYKEQIAGPSISHKDQNLLDENEEVDFLQLEKERRIIDNYIKQLDTFNFENFNDRNITPNLNTKNMDKKNNEINIHISGNNATVGNIILDKVVGNINTNLKELNTKGLYDISEAIRSLTEAVSNNQVLLENDKIEYIENFQFLSEEAGKSPEKRNNAVIKNVLSTVGKGLEVSSNLAGIWGTFGPQIIEFFKALS